MSTTLTFTQLQTYCDKLKGLNVTIIDTLVPAESINDKTIIRATPWKRYADKPCIELCCGIEDNFDTYRIYYDAAIEIFRFGLFYYLVIRQRYLPNQIKIFIGTVHRANDLGIPAGDTSTNLTVR